MDVDVPSVDERNSPAIVPRESLVAAWKSAAATRAGRKLAKRWDCTTTNKLRFYGRGTNAVERGLPTKMARMFLTAVMQYGLMHAMEGIRAIPLDLYSDKI